MNSAAPHRNAVSAEIAGLSGEDSGVSNERAKSEKPENDTCTLHGPAISALKPTDH
jgi:hypothetical protein